MAIRNPGAQNINPDVHPDGSGQDQDSKVLDLLDHLISAFGDVEKTILFRTFESLDDYDNEKSPDLKKCHQNFKRNLDQFRMEFPKQKPLFRNIGYVAQRIGRNEQFRNMFDRPKLPPFLQYNKETHTRIYILIKHYQADMIIVRPQPEEVNKNMMLFIGYFFTFATKNNESTLEIQDAVVWQNGMKLEPIVWKNEEKPFPIYILSDLGNNESFQFKLALNESFSQPKTLFSWFCVQQVSFHPACRISINHQNNNSCQVNPNFFCKIRNICPTCSKSYSNKEVLISGGMPQSQPPPQPVMQQPYVQGYSQMRQQHSYYPQNYNKPMQQMPGQPQPPLAQISNQQAMAMQQAQLQHMQTGQYSQIQQQMQAQQKGGQPPLRSVYPMPVPQSQVPPQQTMQTQMPQRQVPPQMQQQYQSMQQPTPQPMQQHPMQQQMIQQPPMMSQANLRSPYQYGRMQYQISPPSSQMKSPVMSSAISPTTPQTMQTSPQPGYYTPQTMQPNMMMKPKQQSTNALESWPSILNQTTTDKNKGFESPSIFQDDEYQQFYNEIGCNEIDDIDIDVNEYKDIY